MLSLKLHEVLFNLKDVETGGNIPGRKLIQKYYEASSIIFQNHWSKWELL